MIKRYLLAATCIAAVLSQTASAASVIQEEKIINYKSGDPSVVTVQYGEDGLLERIYGTAPGSDSEQDTIIKNSFDDEGNVEQIMIIFDLHEPETQFQLKLDNEYSGSAISKVTGHLYNAQKKEIESAEALSDEAVTTVNILMNSLINYTAYSDCSFECAGGAISFSKENGDLRTSTMPADAETLLTSEFQKDNKPDKLTLKTADCEISMTYFYDNLGRLEKALSEGDGDPIEYELTYIESTDENGNTVFSDSEDLGFRYVYDASGHLLNCEQKNTGSEKDYYDAEGRLVRKEVYRGGEQPVLVHEYSY